MLCLQTTHRAVTHDAMAQCAHFLRCMISWKYCTSRQGDCQTSGCGCCRAGRIHGNAFTVGITKEVCESMKVCPSIALGCIEYRMRCVVPTEPFEAESLSLSVAKCFACEVHDESVRGEVYFRWRATVTPRSSFFLLASFCRPERR